MKKSILWLAVILWLGTVILAGCGSNNPEQEPEVWMANPASVYCEENGGTLIPAEDEEWNQFAFCQIDEDTICEEWEYYRGECPVEVNSDEEVNEEEINNEEISEEANNEEVGEETSEDLPVAKMRISDDLTQEEIENQINETCGSMWWNWEEGSCVLEDWETIQF